MDQTTGTPTTVVTGVPTIVSSVIVQSIQDEVSVIALGGGGGSSSIGPGQLSESQRSISGAPSATPSPVLSPPGKTFGRNSNGTMVATSTPSNEAELQLYRVLQRASLLAYYDTLLEMGGDDVQQLCDAGEEEFLEIMALVGMASKPLHVRRLQKALHEWATNPLAFQTPLPNIEPTQLIYSPEPSTSRSKYIVSPGFNPTPLMSTTAHSSSTALSPLTPSTGLTSQVTSSSPLLTPTLTEAQVARLSIAAEQLARQLPQREPRAHSSKKRTSRELDQVMAMSETDPRRMDEIRKYGAIYGRFDCKRRPEKPLTLHEVCVNEAAAQICKFIPALLTRRDELFPLARQLVKDCGFGHSASIARFGLVQQHQPTRCDESEMKGIKRSRLSSDNTSSDYSKDAIEESRNNLFAMYQKLGRPFDLSDIAKFSLSRSDYEDNDNDSRFSFSNSSSPPLQLNGSEMDATSNRDIMCGDSGRDEGPKSPSCSIEGLPTSPLGVQVIAASGGHIIAVANPALAMSPALNETLNIKREAVSPDL